MLCYMVSAVALRRFSSFFFLLAVALIQTVSGKSLPHVTVPWSWGGLVIGSHETTQPTNLYPLKTNHMDGTTAGDRKQPGIFTSKTEGTTRNPLNYWGSTINSQNTLSTTYTGSPYIFPSSKVSYAVSLSFTNSVLG